MSASSTPDDPSAPRQTVLASRLSHKVDLADLRVTRLSTELLRVPQSSPLVIGAHHELSWEHDEEALQYLVQFTLDVVERGPSESDPETELAEVPVFTASMTLSVTYSFDGAPEDDEDVYFAFGELSVMHTVYPYLRELVHTLTVRAGLPPLVMPSFLSPVLQGEAETAPE